MKPVFIRGLDEGLYKRARVDALGKGMTIGQWFNRAIALFFCIQSQKSNPTDVKSKREGTK